MPQQCPEKLYFEQEYPVFSAIPDEKTVILTMPLEEAVFEGNRVKHIALEHRAGLIGADVDSVLIDSFPARNGAFTWSVVLVQTFIQDALGADDQWKIKRAEAVKLKKDLVLHFKRAFRKDQDLLKSVREIKKTRERTAIIFDMLALVKLGKANIPLLEKIHMDLALLDKAKTLNTELADIYAQVKIDPDKFGLVKRTCDKAWTHLKEAMDEIYDAGRYLFPEDHKKHDLFYNLYFKKIGKMGGRPKKPSPDLTLQSP